MILLSPGITAFGFPLADDEFSPFCLRIQSRKAVSGFWPFDVDFLRAGQPLGTVTIPELAPSMTTTVTLPAMPCAPGEEIQAIADPLSEVDETDEENNTLSITC